MNQRLKIVDPNERPSVWAALRGQAHSAAESDLALASLMAATILNHESLGDALSYCLARKLEGQDLSAMSLRDIMLQAFEGDRLIVLAAEDDLRAVIERDPTCKDYLQPFLFFKGFLALQTHRVAHWQYNEGRKTLASYLQGRSSELFQVDIHPAARIGSGVFIDHGTGIVIGATAIVGDDVSILQGVTLGGTGAKSGDRHPKVGDGVLLSAGAKVLGNITIGDHAKVAANSVVLIDVPARCTAVGVPARLVNCPTCDEPARTMDHGVPEVS